MTESIILDTNAWLYGTRLLRSPLGIAFVHAARQQRANVLLPEVVESELYAVLRRECDAHSACITKGLRDLESLLGRTFPPLPLPTADDCDRALKERIDKLAPILERVPLTLEHARGALAAVIDRKPPADRGEEYRDSMIWQVVAEASRSRPVHFITSDKAFYEERSLEKGLSRALKEEGAQVAIAPDLRAYLQRVSAAKPTHTEQTVRKIDKAIRAYVEANIIDQVLGLRSLESSELSSFLSESPTAVAHRFEYDYSALYSPDPDFGEDLQPCRCRIIGEALVDLETDNVLELDVLACQLDDGLILDWRESPFAGSARQFANLTHPRIPASHDALLRTR